MRKRDTIYTVSTDGFSLRKAGVVSIGGSSLKWSKSLERHSKKANEASDLETYMLLLAALLAAQSFLMLSSVNGFLYECTMVCFLSHLLYLNYGSFSPPPPPPSSIHSHNYSR